jgi:hypothetical protein
MIINPVQSQPSMQPLSNKPFFSPIFMFSLLSKPERAIRYYVLHHAHASERPLRFYTVYGKLHHLD